MSEWIPIAQWAECARSQRPGIVFELRNSEGLSLFTRCAVSLSEIPHDWKSPPIAFRAVVESPARHSNPIPKPQGKN